MPSFSEEFEAGADPRVHIWKCGKAHAEAELGCDPIATSGRELAAVTIV